MADTQLCMDQEAERNQQLGYYDDYNGNGPLDAEHVERQMVDMMKRLNCRINNQGGLVKFLKKYQRYYDWKDLVDGTWYLRYYHCSGLDFRI